MVFILHGKYDVEYVINNSNLECIVCESNVAQRFVDIKSSCPSLKYLIIFDENHEIISDNLTIIDYKALLKSTKTHTGLSLDSEVKRTEEEDDWIFSIIYSSGTNGDPKGIIVMANGWREDNLVRPKFLYPYSILSLTSLAHVKKKKFF